MIIEALAAAREDIRTKTKAQIDAETASVWGARAVAAYELYRASSANEWIVQAAEYAHEAVEHAAGGPPGTLERIKAELSALTGGLL